MLPAGITASLNKGPVHSVGTHRWSEKPANQRAAGHQRHLSYNTCQVKMKPSAWWPGAQKKQKAKGRASRWSIGRLLPGFKSWSHHPWMCRQDKWSNHVYISFLICKIKIVIRVATAQDVGDVRANPGRDITAWPRVVAEEVSASCRCKWSDCRKGGWGVLGHLP